MRFGAIGGLNLGCAPCHSIKSNVAIEMMVQRKKSSQAFVASDILLQRLKNLICKLYLNDFALYKLLFDGWVLGWPRDLGYLVD